MTVCQAYPFVLGFRVSPDDILYHWYALHAPSDWFKTASSFAHEQGRVGHFLSIPLMMLGASVSGFLLMRIIIILAYFSVLLGFAYLVSLVLRKNLTGWIFLFFISFHPLAYSHLPPNAYPLLITIPLFIILAVQIWLTRINQDTKGISLSGAMLAYLLLTLALLTHEYAMIFGGLLFCIGWLGGLICESNPHLHPGNHAKKQGQARIEKINLLAIFTVGVMYLAFRLSFPSSYAGNTTDRFGNPILALKTLLAHAYFGTSFGPVVNFQNTLISIPSIDAIDPIHIGISLLVSLLTCILSWMLSQNFQRIDRLIWAIGIAIAFGILCALPIALISKYQQWVGSCSFSAGGIGCAYIDSRLSYLGYMGALALSSIGILTAPFSLVKKFYLRSVIALVLGLVGGYTYLHNWVISEQIRQYVSPWKTANQLACTSSWNSLSDAQLIARIDPSHVLLYHPDFDQAAYWRAYILDQGHALVCP